MRKTVLLDSSILGILVTQPDRSAAVAACGEWFGRLYGNRHRIIVPEITDYELRRELLRLKRDRAVGKLDGLGAICEYLAVTTDDYRLAAELWAEARNAGRPTAADTDLDADVILAAQTRNLRDPAAVIATRNVRHLARFAPALDWTAIDPAA